MTVHLELPVTKPHPTVEESNYFFTAWRRAGSEHGSPRYEIAVFEDFDGAKNWCVNNDAERSADNGDWVRVIWNILETSKSSEWPFEKICDEEIRVTPSGFTNSRAHVVGLRPGITTPRRMFPKEQLSPQEEASLTDESKRILRLWYRMKKYPALFPDLPRAYEVKSYKNKGKNYVYLKWDIYPEFVMGEWQREKQAAGFAAYKKLVGMVRRQMDVWRKLRGGWSVLEDVKEGWFAARPVRYERSVSSIFNIYYEVAVFRNRDDVDAFVKRHLSDNYRNEFLVNPIQFISDKGNDTWRFSQQFKDTAIPPAGYQGDGSLMEVQMNPKKEFRGFIYNWESFHGLSVR